MVPMVQLLPAFQWNCPACGYHNFHRGELLAVIDEDGDPGPWIKVPANVVCGNCKESWEVEDA